MDNKEEITKSLIFAMRRCDSVELDVVSTAKDIDEEFRSKLYLKEILKGIRCGAMGKYGVNYKITTQVVGSWIYKFIKDN